MKEGSYLKPLKFLGLTYDGVALRGHSRRSGIHEAAGAEQRTKDILKRLKELPEDADRSGDRLRQRAYQGIRRDLARLIAESCDPSFIRRSPERRKQLATREQIEAMETDKTHTWWERTTMRIQKIRNDSLEAQMVSRLPTAIRARRPHSSPFGRGYDATFGRVTESTNTATMMGAYYMMNFLSLKLKPVTYAEQENTGIAKIINFLEIHMSKHGGEELPFPTDRLYNKNEMTEEQ
jgi:hypothetical protein